MSSKHFSAKISYTRMPLGFMYPDICGLDFTCSFPYAICIISVHRTCNYLQGFNIKYAVFSIPVYIYRINLLKPSGFFMFHQVEYSKILHGAHFVLSVLYGYQNKQQLFPYTSLTDWLL